jgi:chemotaxis protein CheD
MNQHDGAPVAPYLYHLEPGYVFGSRERTIIRTVLGSCVAITLWDKNTRTGAMCHFLFPSPGKNDPPTSCFGPNAFTALLSIMKEYGCPPQHLIAQIYGGARPSFDSVSSIGSDNIRMAQKLLLRERILFASEDTGGILGRKVLFDTWTGETAVTKVNRLRQGDWHESLRGI